METEIKIMENIGKDFMLNYFKTFNYDEKIEWLNKGTIEDIKQFKNYCEKNDEFEICSFIKKYIENKLFETHNKIECKINNMLNN